METNSNSVILNDLVQINNDRIEGYEKALSELSTEDSDLKQIFLDLIDASRDYKMALATEVAALGKDIETGTTNAGKIYRTWMDVKAIFTGHGRKAILSNCGFGEDAALKAYKSALETDMPAYLRVMIEEQMQSLRLAHNQIKALRDQ